MPGSDLMFLMMNIFGMHTVRYRTLLFLEHSCSLNDAEITLLESNWFEVTCTLFIVVLTSFLVYILEYSCKNPQLTLFKV